MENNSAQLYPLTGSNQFIVRFQVPLSPDDVQNTSLRRVILLADISGSMSGTPLTYEKEAILKMLDYFKSVGLPSNQVEVWTFHTSVEKIKGDYDKLTHSVQMIRSNGSTGFETLLQEINSVIGSNESVSFVILTDGEDTVDSTPKKSKVAEMMKLVREKITRSRLNITFDTIGFRSEADVRFLTDLTMMGSGRSGTFQHISDSTSIVTALTYLQNVIGLRPRPQVTVTCAGSETGYKVYLNENGVGFLIINDPTNNLTIKTLDGKTFTLSTSVQSAAPSDSLKFVMETYRNLCMKLLTDLPRDGKAMTKQEFDRVNKMVCDSDERLNLLQKDIYKQSHFSRPELMQIFLETKEFISGIMSMLRSTQGSKITNEMISNLANMAYRGELKRGMQKALDKRALQNANLQDEVYQKVESIKNNLNEMGETDLNALVSPEHKALTCYISCMNPVEAMKTGDVMCLTLTLTHPQVGVVDPSKITIKSVCPSMMTYGAFLNTIIYKLGQNQAAHGGFDNKKAVGIVEGESREPINAIIPMFICKEHWSMARELMKLAFGWMCTFDILGYSFKQVVTIPFLVLGYLLEQDATEFNLRYRHEVLKVCQQICLDYPKYFQENVINLLNNYVSNPAVRTADVIENNYLFLLQIYVLKTLNLVNDMQNGFALRLFEEELRRQTNPVDRIDWLELLNVDIEKLINQPAARYRQFKLAQNKQSQSTSLTVQARDKMLRLLQARGIQVTDPVGKEENTTSQTEFTEEKITYQGLMPNFSFGAKKLIETNRMMYRRCVGKFNTLMNSAPTELDGFNLTNEQLLALCLQNLSHARNADRREAIEKGKYVDFTDPLNAQLYLRDHYTTEVMNAKTSAFNHIDDEFSRESASEASNAFALTTDVITAAGLLHGVYIGRVDFHYFIEALQSNPVPLIEEKLAMMCEGHYKGIRLLMDGARSGFPGGRIAHWDPSPHNRKRIIRSNPQAIKKKLKSYLYRRRPETFDVNPDLED